MPAGSEGCHRTTVTGDGIPPRFLSVADALSEVSQLGLSVLRIKIKELFCVTGDGI